jgi:hypothetical protein
MTGEARPPQVAEQLQRVARMETALAQRLARGSSGFATDHLERMRSLAEQHIDALKDVAGDPGVSVPETPEDGPPPATSPTAGLEDALSAAAGLAFAYATLYATARLLFEGEICDVAYRHGSNWMAELGSGSEAVAVAAIRELVADGQTCRCICPACGIGACGCMRNSIETVRAQWGRPGLEASEGIELRISPRPDSQLAKAGLREGDRIVAIDGAVVHDLGELQQALRGGAIGEPRTARVVRGDSETEISIARVSDLI